MQIEQTVVSKRRTYHLTSNPRLFTGGPHSGSFELIASNLESPSVRDKCRVVHLPATGWSGVVLIAKIIPFEVYRDSNNGTDWLWGNIVVS